MEARFGDPRAPILYDCLLHGFISPLLVLAIFLSP